MIRDSIMLSKLRSSCCLLEEVSILEQPGLVASVFFAISEIEEANNKMAACGYIYSCTSLSANKFEQ